LCLVTSSNLFSTSATVHSRLRLALNLKVHQMQMKQHTHSDASVKPTRTDCSIMGPLLTLTGTESMKSPVVDVALDDVSVEAVVDVVDTEVALGFVGSATNAAPVA